MMDDDDRPRKKRRMEIDMEMELLDLDPGGAPAPPLPADVWAQALDYLYMDETLQMSSLNRFFLQEVSPLVQHLQVRNESNLKVGAAVRRFRSVTNVRITCLVGGVDVRFPLKLRLTSQRFLPFLLCFAHLQDVFVGGEKLGNRGAFTNSVRRAYRKTMIQQVCEAYSLGRLNQQVKIEGLLGFSRCPFARGFRDVSCPVCPMICRSFPPRQVMEFQNEWVGTCVPIAERLDLATIRRVPQARLPQSDLNKKLIHHLERAPFAACVVAEPAMALGFRRIQMDNIDWLIRNGADPRQPEIRRLLLSPQQVPSSWCFLTPGFDHANPNHPRRITKATFQKLREWNMDVSELDFRILDEERGRRDLP